MANKTASGLGMTRKRSDGSWEGRVTIGYSETGKRIRKSVYGKTEEQVVEKMKLIHGQLATNSYIEPSKMKVSEWMEIWSREYLNSVKESTRRSYRCIIKNRIIPGIGSYKLKNIQPHIIQSFYNRLSDDGLSAKTVKNTHGVLHKALDVAVKIGYISNNPAAVCDIPKIEKYDFKFIDKTQVNQFFDLIIDNYYELYFKICLFTGIRMSEALGLTWECVDLDRGTITIEKQANITGRKPNKVITFGTPKNGKSRVITPAPFVMLLLNQIKVKQKSFEKQYGNVFQNPFNLVFTYEDGTPYSQTSINKNLRACINGSDLPRLRFHDLRHSYAVLSIQAGDDFKTISENMGHFSVAFTMDTYAKVSEQMKKESADKMQNLFNSLMSNG